MKAMLIRRFGPADVFEPAELATPQQQAGQVLIAVRASSVNPIDTRIRNNGPAMAPPLPAVLHGDVAGIVAAVGDGVTAFKPGDAVYGCAGGVKGHGGALAEFMVADARLLAHKPAKLSFAEAAALPLVTLTAWEALFDRARLQSGEQLLVFGGTGGVGHIAVQLARQAGARVTAVVSSAAKAALARQLGAHAVIDRSVQDIAATTRELTNSEGFDLVFDGVGGAVLAQSFALARIGGRVVTIQARGTHDLSALHERNLSLHAEFMVVPLLHGHGRERHGEILRLAAALVDEEKLQPLLDAQRFGFTRVTDAHRHLESGKAVGKIVLENDWAAA